MRLLAILAVLGLACAAPTRSDDSGPSCSDDLKNGDEADVDCGGSCSPCANGGSCTDAAGCASGSCTAGKCAKPADCSSDPDGAFCAKQQKTCGAAAGIDNCGELRTVTCGDACPVPLTCQASSGVPDGVAMAGLSDAQMAALCDFMACGWGGYGKSVKCDALTFNGPKDPASCKQKLPQCAGLTVGDLLGCEKLVEASPCDSIKTLFGAPECAKVKGCATSPSP